jgi:hypothetical protein
MIIRHPRTSENTTDLELHLIAKNLHSKIQELEEKNKELTIALFQVMSSLECYRALKECPPEDEWDQYDSMMIPFWRHAVEILHQNKVEVFSTLKPFPKSKEDAQKHNSTPE